MVSVVLFSGGRGSDVLSRQLVGQPDVALTIAINGYDDGASTGEVRRFLGDSLGPSDFRKNASRVARETRSCPEGIIEVLDTRLPNPCSRRERPAALERASPSQAAQLDAPAHRRDAAGARVGPLLRVLRLRGRQPRVCRLVSAARAPLQRRGRRLLRAARPAARARATTSPTARTPFWWRSSDDRGVLVQRSRDRRRETTEPHLGCLSDRSPAVRRGPARRWRRSRTTQCATWLDGRSRTMPSEPAACAASRRRGPHHLRARHAALEPVSLVPDGGPQQGDCVESDGDQAARHQHPGRRGDLRQHAPSISSNGPCTT